MTYELYRVEEAISAISSGSLDPETHAHSCILALGLSGQRNRLGASVLHLIERPGDNNRRVVLFFLAGTLQQKGVCKSRESIDVATEAIKWFEDRHCPKCHGRGVLNFEQAICGDCSGKGERSRPKSRMVADAVAVIEQALDWLESQQRARLSGA